MFNSINIIEFTSQCDTAEKCVVPIVIFSPKYYDNTMIIL